MRGLALAVMLLALAPARARSQERADVFGEGQPVEAEVVADDAGGRVLQVARGGRILLSAPLEARLADPVEVQVRRVPRLKGQVIVVYEMYFAGGAQISRASAFAASGPCSLGRLVRLDAEDRPSLERQLSAKLAQADEPPQRTEKASAMLDARRDWQPIGAMAACTGEEVEVTASGAWTIRRDAEPTPPDGYVMNPEPIDQRVNRKGNAGALLCRVGPDEAGAVVGRSGSFRARTEGVVECRINDARLEDNAGRIQVTVRLVR